MSKQVDINNIFRRPKRKPGSKPHTRYSSPPTKVRKRLSVELFPERAVTGYKERENMPTINKGVYAKNLADFRKRSRGLI